MDTTITTITTITKDTSFIIPDTLNNTITERHVTTETRIHNKQNECWLNLCDCNLISELLWPLTVLIILFTFKKQVQKIVDSIGERIKNGAKFKLSKDGIEVGQELSETQLNEKAQKEYKEAIKETSVEKSDNIIPITQTEFVPKYLHIERRIFEVLLNSLYPRYKILSNRKIGEYEYDLIIDTLNNKNFDYAIEVKYYPNGINKYSLQDLAVKLDFMTEAYKHNLNKLAKPALIIVTNQAINSETIKETYKHINDPFKNKNHIKLLMLEQSEIDNLSRTKIIEFLED